MKKDKDKMTDQGNFQNKFNEFANEYLTQKNILVGLGVASLAGLATYSTVRALKNERLVNKIKKELNIEQFKDSVNSSIKGLGLFGKKGGQASAQSQERGGVKSSNKSTVPRRKSNKFAKS